MILAACSSPLTVIGTATSGTAKGRTLLTGNANVPRASVAQPFHPAQVRTPPQHHEVSSGRESEDTWHGGRYTDELISVVETLAELSKYVRMAIVTTAKRVDFEIIHEKRQITQFMDFVLVREDYKLAKPHPEPYLTGLQRLGATREETLVVEDSSRGLNSAVAAGIDCVIVHNDFTKAHDFSQATYRIETLIELKDIILNAT